MYTPHQSGRRRWAAVSAAFWLAACQPSAEPPPTASAASGSIPDTASPVMASQAVAVPPDLLQQLMAATAALQQRLTQATPDEADALYLAHRRQLHHFDEQPAASGWLVRLEQMQLALLSDFPASAAASAALSPDWQQRQEALAAAGLRYMPLGEGLGAAIVVAPDYYPQLFGSRLSPLYQRFVTLEAEQWRTPPLDGGRVALDWDVLADRLAEWEALAAAYGDGELSPALQYHQAQLQNVLLLGSSENPSFSGRRGVQPAVRRAWQRFARQYPDSPTATLMRQLGRATPVQAQQLVQQHQAARFDAAVLAEVVL